jgi:hypothetical protein
MVAIMKDKLTLKEKNMDKEEFTMEMEIFLKEILQMEIVSMPFSPKRMVIHMMGKCENISIMELANSLLKTISKMDCSEIIDSYMAR